MTIFIYFLLSMTIVSSKIIIQDAGIQSIEEDDMAMIFYLTIQNQCETEANICLSMIKCTETGTAIDYPHHMYLLGYVGTIDSQDVQNITLIYPNVVLIGRVGICYVSMTYQVGEISGQIEKAINFDSSQSPVASQCKAACMSPNDCTNCGKKMCPSYDLDPTNLCQPADCVVKYSSTRNFYNKESQLCEPPASCPMGHVYLPGSNTCKNFRPSVTTPELQLLNENVYDRDNPMTSLTNFECHHGSLDTDVGDCYCNTGWTTSPCPEAPYQPSLLIYHMCNIELTEWGSNNNEKIIMTVVAVVIFSIAILAKMLIAICILNWCCNWLRKRRKRERRKRSGAKCNICYRVKFDGNRFGSDRYLSDQKSESSISSNIHPFPPHTSPGKSPKRSPIAEEQYQSY